MAELTPGGYEITDAEAKEVLDASFGPDHDLGMTEEQAQEASAAHEPDDDSPIHDHDLTGHALAQQAVRDTGLCGELIDGGQLCIKISGHELPHGSGPLEAAVADPLTATRITPEELEYMNKIVEQLGGANALAQRIDELRDEIAHHEAEINAHNARAEGYLQHLMVRYGCGPQGSINSEDGAIQRPNQVS
jgi:hypothetical protein